MTDTEGITPDTDGENRADDRTRIIVAGSRNITNYELLRRIFLRGPYRPHDGPDNYEIVSGCARGVDQLGIQYAEEWGISVRRFPADWDSYPRSAGHRRNAEMAKYADVLVALWDYQSPGTESMIEKAHAAEVEVHTYHPEHLVHD